MPIHDPTTTPASLRATAFLCSLALLLSHLSCGGPLSLLVLTLLVLSFGLFGVGTGAGRGSCGSDREGWEGTSGGGDGWEGRGHRAGRTVETPSPSSVSRKAHVSAETRLARGVAVGWGVFVVARTVLSGWRADGPQSVASVVGVAVVALCLAVVGWGWDAERFRGDGRSKVAVRTAEPTGGKDCGEGAEGRAAADGMGMDTARRCFPAERNARREECERHGGTPVAGEGASPMVRASDAPRRSRCTARDPPPRAAALRDRKATGPESHSAPPLPLWTAGQNVETPHTPGSLPSPRTVAAASRLPGSKRLQLDTWLREVESREGRFESLSSASLKTGTSIVTKKRGDRAKAKDGAARDGVARRETTRKAAGKAKQATVEDDPAGPGQTTGPRANGAKRLEGTGEETSAAMPEEAGMPTESDPAPAQGDTGAAAASKDGKDKVRGGGKRSYTGPAQQGNGRKEQHQEQGKREERKADPHAPLPHEQAVGEVQRTSGARDRQTPPPPSTDAPKPSPATPTFPNAADPKRAHASQRQSSGRASSTTAATTTTRGEKPDSKVIAKLVDEAVAQLEGQFPEMGRYRIQHDLGRVLGRSERKAAEVGSKQPEAQQDGGETKAEGNEKGKGGGGGCMSKGKGKGKERDIERMGRGKEESRETKTSIDTKKAKETQKTTSNENKAPEQEHQPSKSKAAGKISSANQDTDMEDRIEGERVRRTPSIAAIPAAGEPRSALTTATKPDQPSPDNDGGAAGRARTAERAPTSKAHVGTTPSTGPAAPTAKKAGTQTTSAVPAIATARKGNEDRDATAEEVTTKLLQGFLQWRCENGLGVGQVVDAEGVEIGRETLALLLQDGREAEGPSQDCDPSTKREGGGSGSKEKQKRGRTDVDADQRIVQMARMLNAP